jgi:hypothetical protein
VKHARKRAFHELRFVTEHLAEMDIQKAAPLQSNLAEYRSLQSRTIEHAVDVARSLCTAAEREISCIEISEIATLERAANRRKRLFVPLAPISPTPSTG